MRLRLEVDGLVLFEVRLLERDDDDTDDADGPAGSLGSTVELDGKPAPFGFRPTPDPWPPSWE